jgi:hypothetical protein
MVKKRKPSSGIMKIEASAKANVAAIYNVSKKVTEVIPEDVTRAKANSWLDLISPLTEWTGLKGDQIRLRRDVLRLQREETLSRIAEIITSKGSIRVGDSPIPLKFVVNYLEKASLEEPDDHLVELWANLLISAAEEYNPRQLHFSNVISQLSSHQAKIFQTLIGSTEREQLLAAYHDIELFVTSVRIKDAISFAVSNLSVNIDGDGPIITSENIHKVCVLCSKAIKGGGVTAVFGAVDYHQDTYELDLGWTPADDNNLIDYDILVSLGLASRVDTGRMLIEQIEVSLLYYHITAMDVSFAESCKIVT